jgi:transposase-like protein
MGTIIQPVATRAKRGPITNIAINSSSAVACTLVAGASVSLIARELNINTNQLFSWRKRFGADAPADSYASSQLAAVTVVGTKYLFVRLAIPLRGKLTLLSSSAFTLRILRASREQLEGTPKIGAVEGARQNLVRLDNYLTSGR